MKTPIIMVAFGTTSKAKETYQHIEKITRDRFKNYEIFWSFSSRIITKQLQQEGMREAQHPVERFNQLTGRGFKSAVVQSLHLFGGNQFDSLIKDMQEAKITCIPGAPLISSPQDYHDVCQVLRPLITTHPKQATLVLGHGTYHPSWVSYYCLETFFRQQFGPHIFVGTVEGYPNTDHLVNQISAAGYEKVRIIPFFLVTGMHYRRDITGDSESSWQSRLRKKNLAVETIEQGLGMLPGFADIIVRHIEEAINKSNT